MCNVISLIGDSCLRSDADIIVVLDVSGSMGGNRIKTLKKAMNILLDTLTTKDRLSMITFNHKPTLISGFK